MKLDIKETITLPSEVTATYSKGDLNVKGPKGEVTRKLQVPNVKLEVKGNDIILSAKQGTKREKRMINTFAAHVRNLVQGVQEPFVYELKICSGHFPMNVALQGDTFTIKNFLGEKKPRTLKVKTGAKVKIQGDKITVESPNKELAGGIASDIELLTSVQGRDRRIFQDGIYLTVKAGKKVGGK